MNGEMIIEVKKLCKAFRGKQVVDNLNLQIKKGEVFGFLGPNGSGKTTTIRMLCGLLTPDSGQGTCLGYNLVAESQKIKQHVGYMTQKFSFYNELSIQENLMMMARIYCLDRRKERVEEALVNFGLADRQRQLTKELSGGWKQRLALAACLLHEPDLLLLDEPTAGVDPLARREFWDKIHFLSERGITILVSTHYMDEAERCTRLAYLASGHLLVVGTIGEVILSTKLHTWVVSGSETTKLLQEIKKIEGITQAALFGNQVHVCGYEVEKVEKGLYELAKKHTIQAQIIETTLEDAFIGLVNQSFGGVR